MYHIRLCCQRLPRCWHETKYFSLTSVAVGKNEGREARFMKKLLGGSRKSKVWHLPSEAQIPSNLLLEKTRKGKATQRRLAVLSKVFMSYISELLSTGEIAPEIEGKGLQIVKVKITQDVDAVNVHWYTTQASEVQVLEDILKKSRGILRHELSQLKVIGVVPKIDFVRDKEYEKIAEVDRLLAKADFGEDYEPVDRNHFIKSEFLFHTDLKNEMQIVRLEQKSSNGLEHEEDCLPPMRMDVLGLDHARIMSHIQAGVKRSSDAAQRRASLQMYSDVPSLENQEMNSSEDDLTIIKRKSDFVKFLQKRRQVKRNVMKNYQAETEYYLEEQEKKRDAMFDEYDEWQEEEKDEIEEDWDSDYKRR